MVNKILNRKKINPAKPVFTGKKYLEKPSIQLFEYSKESLSENSKFELKDFKGFPDDLKQHWLNIHGIHDVNLVQELCKQLEIHSLVLQDILDVNQRPKFQEFDHYFFLTIKSILPAENLNIDSEQLSFILGKNFLVSFQEKKADHFDHVRQRLRDKMGTVNHRGSDYLLFLLLESILDNYFKTIENIEKREESFGIIDINSDPSPNLLTNIELLKRELHIIKKTLLPIKEFIIKVERENIALIQPKHIKYFLELKDLCLTLLDNCDHVEFRLESSINLFFSVQGHRMNQVMKILTIVATIFIPLTFVAGVYGMNFTNMPELTWKWGYFGIWAIMILIFIFMLYYFKRKKWF